MGDDGHDDRLVKLPPSGVGSASPAARLAAHSEILQLIAAHSPLATTLATLARLVEDEISGSRASILLVDDDRSRLRVCAAPSLPAAFNDAVDATPIARGSGSCGAAAHLGRLVVCDDIAQDPAWAPWRDAAAAAGLASCWSTPFAGAEGQVLGTFAAYFTEPRTPTDEELTVLHEAGRLAAVAVQQDASQRRLRDLARTDPLTNLPNRDVLADRLRTAQARSRRAGVPFALMLLGVDGIKAVNESFGLAAGDELLRLIAARLLITAGPAATVARVWGDEFAVLLESVHATEDVSDIAGRLHRVLAEPFDVDGFALSASAGLGVAVLGPDCGEAEALRAAGAALERAKAIGRGQVVVHDQSGSGHGDMITLAPALRRGIAAQEFGLAYQPIVRLPTGEIIRYEALLRWTSGDNRGVPPDTFVPLAERMGLVGDLGRHALAEAVAELYRYVDSGADQRGVSVNVSVHQLSDDSLPATVGEALAKYALPASSLTLEVTEGVLLRSGGVGWRILSALRDLGVRIAIDDFGTGFGQLSYLRQFPFDEIKIDRSFVADAVDDPKARAIVASIVSLAAALGAEVVAEGIENQAQRDLLIELGCGYGQGYLIGEPGPMH